MEKIPQIYDLAKHLYDKIVKLNKDMISFIGDDFVVDSEELFIEMDHYLQAILFMVALADDRLVDIELSFIDDIADYEDLFEKDKLSSMCQMSEEQKKDYATICEKVLSSVPMFVQLSVACDKKVDSMCQIIKPTYCQRVFDYLKRLSTYLKFIDGNVKDIEDKVSKKVLTSVVTYYKKHYVMYAPNRKK